MKLVSIEDLGFWELILSKKWNLSMQALFSFLVLGDVSRLSGTNRIKEEASLDSPKKIMYSTNTLEHTLLLLKYMVNEHIFNSHQFSITHQKKLNLH